MICGCMKTRWPRSKKVLIIHDRPQWNDKETGQMLEKMPGTMPLKKMTITSGAADSGYRPPSRAAGLLNIRRTLSSRLKIINILLMQLE